MAICSLIKIKVTQNATKVTFQVLPKPTLWHKIHRYFTLVKDEITPSLSADVPKLEELSWLKEHLSQLESPVVFCHNDLLCKNIIYDSAKGTALQAPQASHFFWALWALIQNQFSTTSFDFLR
ncbi:Ethanolamine kinase 2 [Lemmus lemmus]